MEVKFAVNQDNERCVFVNIGDNGEPLLPHQARAKADELIHCANRIDEEKKDQCQHLWKIKGVKWHRHAPPELPINVSSDVLKGMRLGIRNAIVDVVCDICGKVSQHEYKEEPTIVVVADDGRESLDAMDNMEVILKKHPYALQFEWMPVAKKFLVSHFDSSMNESVVRDKDLATAINKIERK